MSATCVSVARVRTRQAGRLHRWRSRTLVHNSAYARRAPVTLPLMVSVLALVIPLAFAGAISPVMLTEQTVLLAGRDGRRVAGCYAIGVSGTLLALLSALVLFGRSIALPEEPRLSASLDVVLGSLLVLTAGVLRSRRPHTPKPRKSRDHELSPSQALGFGVFSMATNFTTLALMVPVAKEIAASDLDVPARLIVLCIVVLVAALPAWLPLAMTLVAPSPTHRALEALAGFIDTRGRLVTVLLLTAVGLFLVARGIVHIIGL